MYAWGWVLSGRVVGRVRGVGHVVVVVLYGVVGPVQGPPTCDLVTYPMMHLVSHPHLFSSRMTDVCENITFARFTTRAVTTQK